MECMLSENVDSAHSSSNKSPLLVEYPPQKAPRHLISELYNTPKEDVEKNMPDSMMLKKFLKLPLLLNVFVAALFSSI